MGIRGFYKEFHDKRTDFPCPYVISMLLVCEIKN